MLSSPIKFFALGITTLLLCKLSTATALDVVHRFNPPSKDDKRSDYPHALLVAAFEKTRDEFGDYQIITGIAATNFRQKMKLMTGDESYIVHGVYRTDWDKEFRLVPVPITRGLMGLRIFFINKEMQATLTNIESIEELKKIPMGSGNGWASTHVLKHHKFNVVTFTKYKTMFAMLTKKRFELLSRGAHEVGKEYAIQSDYWPSLHIEESFVVDVPLPVYFYVNTRHERLAKRVEKGLTIMINDGTFDKIFHKHFAEVLDKLKLSERKVFQVDNPFLPKHLPVHDVSDLIKREM